MPEREKVWEASAADTVGEDEALGDTVDTKVEVATEPCDAVLEGLEVEDAAGAELAEAPVLTEVVGDAAGVGDMFDELAATRVALTLGEGVASAGPALAVGVVAVPTLKLMDTTFLSDPCCWNELAAVDDPVA